MIKDADIPDYVKFAERENPLEPVVRKLEEKGFNAERAFKAFDEDCDEVLTINEIKEGLRFHKVGLLDTEMKMLVDAMDKNHDGVLTMEEW
jgi:Ca2+-binding EF-hand superfamily protein